MRGGGRDGGRSGGRGGEGERGLEELRRGGCIARFVGRKESYEGKTRERETRGRDLSVLPSGVAK